MRTRTGRAHEERRRPPTLKVPICPDGCGAALGIGDVPAHRHRRLDPPVPAARRSVPAVAGAAQPGAALRAHGPRRRRVQVGGDALLVAFDSAAGAFAAAVDAQRRIACRTVAARRSHPGTDGAPHRHRLSARRRLHRPRAPSGGARRGHGQRRPGGGVRRRGRGRRNSGGHRGPATGCLPAARLRRARRAAPALGGRRHRQRISGPPSNTSRRPQRVAAARRLRRSFDGDHRARGSGGARPTGDARRPRGYGEDPTRGRVRARRRARRGTTACG